MSKFKEKRDSLELFTKEQIIGPGAYNKRFFFLDDWDNKAFEFADKSLFNVSAIQNNSEVIPEVPAYQYSSAILFPQTTLKKLIASSNEIIDTGDEIDDDDNATNTSTDDEEIIEDITESLISKQQNYPNQVGLSFVINGSADLNKDIEVNVQFRKYYQFSKGSCLSKGISIWVPEYVEEIRSAIDIYFKDLFKVENRSGNYFVAIKTELSKEALYEIDYKNLNEFLRMGVIEELQNVFKNDLVELNNRNNVKYFGISLDGQQIQFYSLGSKKYRNQDFQNVFTLFDGSLIKYIQEKLEISIQEYGPLRVLIQQIEVYNQLKNIVTDLKSIFKERQPTPIWQSRFFNIKLVLPEFDKSKKIERKELISIDDNNPELKELFYKTQYIKNRDLIYVKIILINQFKIELKPNEPPQLNKKDNANKNSFFGIQLKVTETTNGSLKQYNPPQLLDIDDEDNFNKLLYRNYLDYGEGYNTSVTWGKTSGLTFISTDFLPEQETPKVDFTPSKLVDGAVVKRLKDENVLSIRYLSTLSESTNEDIINGLESFIGEYKTWISEKRIDLNLVIGDENKEILKRQLESCEIDYKRLIRNIKLLQTDPKAMAAFRLMNTAMFMQLHHSILKKFSYPFKEKLDEHYYKEVALEKEYQWRSFQLAFVLLNIDGFVRPDADDKTVEDIFGTKWPERNEIADLVWFPTGGGKTEAYLGIIAFVVTYRRFIKGVKGFGTTALMRYTLRLLTLQQFQRATLLICALEVIRKDCFTIPANYDLGDEKITIGLFVGQGSLPNNWIGGDSSMHSELSKISDQILKNKKVATNLPFTDCPWCGQNLFTEVNLDNIYPNHANTSYGINDELSICCNNEDCAYYSSFPTPQASLPVRLFDEDIYKYPPTLLFGTVDKFAALANKITTNTTERNKDSRRLLGKGYRLDVYPPELIIQDELHLLLGPLGTAVGLFEKGIDYLCSYTIAEQTIKPKIITSTATTRNTDKQIFALFNRRSEIFPKQGITCDDSFFAFYERRNKDEYISNRKYIGILPIGKTQVWMQLRMASIALTHRLKYLKEKYSLDEIFTDPIKIETLTEVFDFYHTILSYFNSLKDVGKTQSQLSHYLPGDVNYVTKNTIPWSFLNKLIRKDDEIHYAELTGRLTGEEVKTNLSDIESKWGFFDSENGIYKLKINNPPEFVISTNMISVGIDVSRFNTMIISSMPRNVAEYIQASSRVARNKEGIVFTIHHPFRSRDISHYQKFKEFHEKFYSYVEPISVTPFAFKALDRYLAMLAAVLIRHSDTLGLQNNDQVGNNVIGKKATIKQLVLEQIMTTLNNADKLDDYLRNRTIGIRSSVDGIISQEELLDTENKLDLLINNWLIRLTEASSVSPSLDIRFRIENNPAESLFISLSDDNHPYHWKVSHSLREIAPSTVIKTVQQ